MGFVVVLLLVMLFAPASSEFSCPVREAVSVQPSDPFYSSKPFVNGAREFIHGTIKPWGGEVENITSPIFDSSTGERAVIGELAQMGETDALRAVESARRAWNNGQGTWPQMTAQQRIQALERVVVSLKSRKKDIVDVLMWEICKTAEDATVEFGQRH